jgi:hypothetical protein
VTVQVPAEVVHWAEAGLKEPDVEGDAENVTVPPVGVMAVPEDVSDTVAVQVVGPVTGTLAGEQETLMEVVLVVAMTVPAPLLVVWRESPE